MESRNISEAKEKILQKLEEAKQKRAVNILEALVVLEEIKKLLPDIRAEKQDKASTKNASNNKLENEVKYYQKRAHIYYELEDYDEAANNFKEIKKLLPNISQVYKEIGDCYRKKKEYEKAIKEYHDGIARIDADDYAEPSDKADLLNSEALVYIGQEKYDIAVKKLDEAIKIVKDNPLYICNKGAALYTKGDHPAAMECFKQAQELSKSDKRAKGLTPENYAYIDKTLTNLFDHINKMDKVPLKKKDDFLENRKNRVISDTVEKMMHFKGQEAQQEEMKQVLTSAEKIAKIQNDPDLNCYYDGFLFVVSQAYHTSVIVLSGQVSLDTGSTVVDVASKLISYIPLFGDAASGLLSSGYSFYKDAKIKKAANYVSSFTSSASLFDDLVQDVIADVVLRKEGEIKDIKIDKVDEVILPGWKAKFKKLIDAVGKAVDNINDFLYGDRCPDPFQKLGFKSGSDLISKHLATGLFYEGKVSARISPAEKRAKLTKLVEEFVSRDVEHSRKGAAYVPPKEESLNFEGGSTQQEESPVKQQQPSSSTSQNVTSPTKTDNSALSKSNSAKKKGCCF